MMKISARLHDDEFLGTAEELAAFVSDKLDELGFGDRHRSTERLVRFYTYQGLLSKPERAEDDRRKANFGPLQVRQLLLARLLAERGWDLDRIGSLLRDNPDVQKLNQLIDELATPTEAEKLFFKTRSSPAMAGFNDDMDSLQEPDASFSLRKKSAPRNLSSSGAPSPSQGMPRQRSYALIQQIKLVAESESPAESFRILLKKEMMRPDISEEAREFLAQLKAFNPTSHGDEPRSERWTRLRLTYWCEAHFNIDSSVNPTKEELLGIVDGFSKALMNKYL